MCACTCGCARHHHHVPHHDPSSHPSVHSQASFLNPIVKDGMSLPTRVANADIKWATEVDQGRLDTLARFHANIPDEEKVTWTPLMAEASKDYWSLMSKPAVLIAATLNGYRNSEGTGPCEYGNTTIPKLTAFLIDIKAQPIWLTTLKSIHHRWSVVQKDEDDPGIPADPEGGLTQQMLQSLSSQVTILKQARKLAEYQAQLRNAPPAPPAPANPAAPATPAAGTSDPSASLSLILGQVVQSIAGMADMMKQNTKATADALASAHTPTSNPSNPPAQTDAPAEDAVSKYDAHIKKYSLHVDSLAFFDPLLICDKHLSKLEDIHMSQNTLRTQLGNGLTVVSNDLNVKIGQAWMYHPGHFRQGLDRLLEMMATSRVEAVRDLVPDRLKFFRQVWSFYPVADGALGISRQVACVRYFKRFMSTYPKERDWCALFKSDSSLLLKFLQTDVIRGVDGLETTPSWSGGGGGGGGGGGNGGPRGGDGGGPRRKRGGPGGGGPTTKRPRKASKGGGNPNSILACNSRMQLSGPGASCAHQPNCRYNHECLLCPNQFHALSQCPNKDEAKARAANDARRAAGH